MNSIDKRVYRFRREKGNSSLSAFLLMLRAKWRRRWVYRVKDLSR